MDRFEKAEKNLKNIKKKLDRFEKPKKKIIFKKTNWSSEKQLIFISGGWR